MELQYVYLIFEMIKAPVVGEQNVISLIEILESPVSARRQNMFMCLLGTIVIIRVITKLNRPCES